jgi:hypothetical protein
MVTTPTSTPSADVAACASKPEVRAWADERVRTALEEHANEQHVRSEKTRVALSGVIAEQLRVSPEEQSWLNEYACAMYDQRRDFLTGLETAAGAEVAWERLRREREDAVAALESFLGAERYTRLREVGGVNLVAEAAGCK